MSTAPITEPQASNTDLGHRLFVLGIFAIFMAEVAITISNFGYGFGWYSTLFGACCSLVILVLGNWLYSGNKTALTVTRLWVLLQIVIVLGALISLLGTTRNAAPEPGIHAIWQGVLKLVVYVAFLSFLTLPGPTLNFLSSRRGETPTTGATAVKEETAPGGSPVELNVEQTKALEGMASAMKMASGALLLVGLLLAFAGLRALIQSKDAFDNAGLVSVVEGVSIAGLGAILGGALAGLRQLLDTTPRRMGLVLNLFALLLTAYKAYAVLLIVLAGIAIRRVFM